MAFQLKHCDSRTLPEGLQLSGQLIENDFTQFQNYEESLETTCQDLLLQSQTTDCKSPTALPRMWNWLRIQLEMQRFRCPSGTNTRKKNRKNGGYLKGLNLILFICFNFYCLYHFTNFFIGTDCVISDLSLWNKSLKKWGSTRGIQYECLYRK